MFCDSFDKCPNLYAEITLFRLADIKDVLKILFSSQLYAIPRVSVCQIFPIGTDNSSFDCLVVALEHLYQNLRQPTRKRKITSFSMIILSGLLIAADVMFCKASIDYTSVPPMSLAERYEYLSDWLL